MSSPLIVLLTRASSQLPFPDTFYLDSRCSDYSFLEDLQQDPRIGGVLNLFTAPSLFFSSSYFSFPPPSASPPSPPPQPTPPPQSRSRCGWKTVKSNIKQQWKRLTRSSNHFYHGTSSEPASTPTTPVEQTESSTPGPHEAACSP